MNRSTRSTFTRIAVIGAAAATLFAVSSGPALAAGVRVSDKTITLPDGRGYMKFHDDGDVFEICDTKADGNGVTGSLKKQYVAGNISTLWTDGDGGDSGCDKHPYNVGNDGWYQMTLKWNGGGSTVTSEWFNE
ncbi:hypothetical protein [Streptomyces sp. KL118A]|uniref:hypothetical protein n=1 Tax=Streptomyces sp. KL118A TaxID=3045153 RepID=UPI00278C3FC1|nr:hypothetical protein [Streptomyces sp. KL118A]